MRPALLTAASACLYAASFPPLEAYGLAWIALAPLLVAVAGLRPRRAAILGLGWGYGVCLLIGWPFGPMLSRHLGLPTWYGWAAFVVAAPALVGAYVAAFSALVARAARRGRASPLFVSATWVAAEYVRQHLSAGIPWALSGYSQVPWLPMAQLADVAGPFGIALLLAAANAQLASVFAPRLRSRHPALSAVALLAMLAASYAYGTMRLAEADEDAPTVRVALVQGGIAPGTTSDPSGRPTDPLERHLELTDTASAYEPDLIVWPEFAIDFEPERASFESARLRDLSDLSGAELVVGGPHTISDLPGDEIIHHNSIYLLDDGRIRARYDKQRPLPVAERAVIGIRRHLGLPSYEAGGGPGVFDTRDGRLGIATCSEAMDPSLMRGRVRAGAEILVNPSNDSWFGTEPAVRQQLRIATMRAIESRRYLLRPTPTGYSAVIDPWGRIREQGTLGEPQVLVATVASRRTLSPYDRMGDALAWSCIVLSVVAALAPPRRDSDSARADRASKEPLPKTGARPIS